MVGGFGVGGVLLYFNYAKARGNNRQENRKGRGGPGKARVVFRFSCRSYRSRIPFFCVAHTSTVGVKVQTRLCMYMYNNTGCRQIGNGRAYVYM